MVEGKLSDEDLTHPACHALVLQKKAFKTGVIIIMLASNSQESFRCRGNQKEHHVPRCCALDVQLVSSSALEIPLQ